VQLAIDDVEARLTPTVHDAFKNVEFALDVSWDVFLVAGTILFGVAMLADPRFGCWFGISGIAVATALYAFNFATFPTPPARAPPDWSISVRPSGCGTPPYRSRLRLRRDKTPRGSGPGA
jgi:hypothetical protein